MAAEEEILTTILNGASGFGAGAMDILIYIALACIVAAIGVFIWWILQFKHKVVVRYLTRNGAFIIEDKVRAVKKDGITYWKFFKSKMEATPPPKAAINITKKGRLFAECYITEDNPEPVWIVDKGINKSNTPVGQSFKPVTTQQRALIVNRIRKAESRKGKSIWEQVSAIAIPVTMAFMVMIPFIFWGDITKTSTDALDDARALSTQNAKIAEQNARILSVLAGKVESGEIDIIQDIPRDADALTIVGVGE